MKFAIWRKMASNRFGGTMLLDVGKSTAMNAHFKLRIWLMTDCSANEHTARGWYTKVTAPAAWNAAASRGWSSMMRTGFGPTFGGLDGGAGP